MNTLHGFNNKYECLSNFAACDTFYANKIIPQGYVFKTSEHAYQAAKATDIGDMMFIAHASTPAAAKRRSRMIEVRPDWDEVKDRVMLEIVRSKFEDPDMRSRILDTKAEGFDELSEDNWWHDNYWGNCLCPKCASIVGQNKLGKILTQVREEIIEEEGFRYGVT